MKPQYPSDYNPPCRGRCETCGYETRGWTTTWLALCPAHWQELARRIGVSSAVFLIVLLTGCARQNAGPWRCADVGTFRYASVLTTDGIRSKVVTTKGEYVVAAYVSGNVGDAALYCRRDRGDTWASTAELRVSGHAYQGVN